jgi:hypothetical protein
MPRNCLALLGRRDEPTDAVEEYCRYLGSALANEGWEFQLERLHWLEQGWEHVLREIGANSKKWDRNWVLLQYTALAWSKRAIPVQLPRLVRTLQRAGARCGVIFHDAQPYSGKGPVQFAKRLGQIAGMRRLATLADLSILTIPLDRVAWLPLGGHFAFVPVGANLPNPESVWPQTSAQRRGGATTIALFSPTGGVSGVAEVTLVIDALRLATAALGPVRLLVLGRSSEEAGRKAQELLSNQQAIPLEVLGLLPGERIVQELGRADALVFIRGGLSTRRGSGIAGIACGLPVIALEDAETAGPVREAGVLFISERSPEQLSGAVVRLFSEPHLRDTLAERSRQAQRNHFSWPAIAKRMASEMEKVGA